MNKLVKVFSAFAVLLIGVLTLVSCGSYNFYDVWTEAGATIEKDHPFEVVELDAAKAKIDADETFVLVLGNPSVYASANSITTMCEQAKVAKFEGKIYFIDVEEELAGISTRKELKDNLGINNPTNAATNLIVVCYNKGEVLIDTSVKATDSSLENFVSGTSVDYSLLSAYIFNDFIFE